jgi:AcrR family transcriptional regulator
VPRDTFFNLPEEKRLHLETLAVSRYAASDPPFSISAYCREAGIAKGSFYQYFEDENDLYRWVLFGVIGQAKLAFMREHRMDEGGDFFAQLGGLLWAGVQFALLHPEYARAAHRVMHPTTPALWTLHRELYASGKANLVAVLARGQVAGQVRVELDLSLGAEILYGVLQNTLASYILGRFGEDLADFFASGEGLAYEGEIRQFTLQLLDFLRRGMGTGSGEPSPDLLENLPFLPGVSR